jgi:hypothetical protein
MGILDEAIREHLELKRQHGADGSELKQLEDEAFGQADRPGDEGGVADPAAEAPTQFMEQPEIADDPAARREPTITDLQEAPPPAPVEEPAPAAEEEPAAVEEPVDETPAEEEHPAMEHEIVTDAPEPAESEIEPEGPSTEERHAIAEQPTQLHDMEEELSAPGPPNPTDEELVEEEIAEPRLAPTDPLAGLEDDDVEVSIKGPAPVDDEDDEDDAFWNEQRLSDELDQALDAPLRSESQLADEPEVEVEPGDEPEPDDDPEAAAPRGDDDVLEETPDFLEETPEDDQLWFEQKPPKDFDFDD